MLIACWSAKGGVGTTVVAAGLGLHLASRTPAGSLLVDLAGDLPIALGCPDTESPGIRDWLAAEGEIPTDALARLERPMHDGVGLITRGLGPLLGGRASLLARLLSAEPRTVVADCGVVTETEADVVARQVAATASVSLLVLRPCFLGLRRAVRLTLRPTGIVVVNDEGRAITSDDIESVLGVPVVARVRVSPAVARAVDAGLLAGALPRTLERDLRHAA
jgi:MinD-like ATPase involved in chromosome partitioning or flagellar assembly